MTILLKDVRESLNISIGELSKISGISKSQISEIERGIASPNLRTLCKIAKALEIGPEKLYRCE